MTFKPALDLPNIEADSTQIQQVLINLILNARDALCGNGTITITTRIGSDTQALPGAASNCLYNILEVEDNGVGIPKDVLHRIFEPFYTTKEVGKGTGLGLAMVYGIIKKHNGFIEVTSALGEGTKFSAFLPVTAKLNDDSADLEIISTQQRQQRKLVVLVVDDEPDLRDFCVTALGEIATEILTASNGVEALEQFEQGQPQGGPRAAGFDDAEDERPRMFSAVARLGPASTGLDFQRLQSGRGRGNYPQRQRDRFPAETVRLEAVDRKCGAGVESENRCGGLKVPSGSAHRAAVMECGDTSPLSHGSAGSNRDTPRPNHSGAAVSINSGFAE